MQAKKIMFTLLGIFVAAMIQAPTIYSVEKWFPVVIGIVALFWAFDSYTYFYQEKLRAAMDVRFGAIKQRYTGSEVFLPAFNSCYQFISSIKVSHSNHAS